MIDIGMHNAAYDYAWLAIVVVLLFVVARAASQRHRKRASQHVKLRHPHTRSRTDWPPKGP